jgi:hypothetical protein
MPEIDLDQRVRTARAAVADAVGPRPPALAVVRRRRTRRRGAGALGVAAALAVVVAVVTAGVGGEGESVRVGPTDHGPDAPPTTAIPGTGTANADLLAPGEVASVAAAPVAGRSSPAAAWTGSEVVLWGGFALDGPVADGAAYDPRTDSWRPLAPAPLDARSGAAAVWTGTEVIVWGGHGAGPSVVSIDEDGRSHSPTSRSDGAAYDPATDTWRPIAPAPIVSAGSTRAVWTGSEAVFLAGTNSVEAAIYDPAADTWRTVRGPGRPIPPYPSIAWTGSEVVAPLMEPRGEDMTPLWHALDPATGRWRELPAAPLGGIPTVAWTGQVVVARDAEGATATFDPATGEWTARDHSPSGLAAGSPTVWTGDRLLVWQPTGAATFDPATGTWSRTPAGLLEADDVTGRAEGASVWADGVFVTWGGFPAVDDGLVLRPADGG